MATAENAKLMYEAGQAAYAMAALTDTGDQTTFAGAASPWSGRSGYEPDIRPDGLISGGALTPKAATNNVVVLAAGTAYVQGVLVAFAAQELTCVRPTADTDTHIVNSIVLASSGTATVVQGASHTAFDTGRGEDGGPALIAVDKIELGQVAFTSRTAGVVSQSEISQVPGSTQERFDVPLMIEVDSWLGRVTFGDAMPEIHVGGLPKNVYASYATPTRATHPKAKDFVPPENTRSVSSEQIYGGTIGSSSQSLGQGSFTAFLNDGINDPLVQLKDENLWFWFYPDRAKSAHLACQGYLGIARTFPAGAQIQASCTISAESAAQGVS